GNESLTGPTDSPEEPKLFAYWQFPKCIQI
ncbi:unnamed protein product, partial [marine sediment metagenome]